MSSDFGLQPANGGRVGRLVSSLVRIGGIGIVVFAAAIGLPELLQRFRDPLTQLRITGRTVEARLTAFDYSPLHVMRGARPSDLQNLEVLTTLTQALNAARTPENLHRLALARLATGQAETACELLQEAARLHPNEPSILSDLAAAEMAIGNVADAAEHSAIAIESNDPPLPAVFNWALALEQLSNRPAAITAWEDYLQRDPGSGWSDEAREHLGRLRAPRRTWEKDQHLFRAGVDRKTLAMLLEHYPGRVRNWTQNSALLIWMYYGKPDQLELVRSVAAHFKEVGDPFLSDVVEHAVVHRDALTAALKPYTAARSAERESRPADALTYYGQAAKSLAEIGSPLAITASIFAAKASYGEKKYGEALKTLDDVDSRLASIGNRYPSMCSESAWIRGLILGRSGKPQESLDVYRRAEAFALQAGETENAVAIRMLIATQLELVGDRAQADRYRMDVLRQSDVSLVDTSRMYTAFMETTLCALRAGRPHLALAFADSQKQASRQLKDPLYRAQSDTWRAMALLELGRIPSAAACIASAQREATEGTTPDWKFAVLADGHFAAGRIAQAEGQPRRAVEEYSSAIEIWTKNGWHLHLANGLMARGDAYLAAGGRAAAEEDFNKVIEEMEAQRADLEEPAMRIAWFERAESVFERLIGLLIDDGRTIDALSVAERKRARFLLDQIAAESSGRAVPLDGNALAAAVQGRTAILEITLLDRGAELWLLQTGRVVHARSTASRAAIEDSVARYLAALTSDDEKTTLREGRWLFDQLIAPVAARLPAGVDLVIVPDGVLQTLPFATLVTSDGGYLVDRWTSSTAPSATAFLRSPSRTRADGLLAVAQPAPRDFDPLPAAESEARYIARQYRQGRALIGDEIGPAAFLDLAAASSVVHFAGHATTGTYRSSQSALQFESMDGPPIKLTAETIGRSHLRSHPLVVLAACGTARGTLRRNEGIDSIASAFLQAGARGVVATLWDVDDAVSARLFRSFHQNLRSGARTADALREAQRSLLHSSNPHDRRPSTWGSAVLIGTL